MNSFVVLIAIILLPGLLASVICDKITVHSQRWDSFKYSIYSFIFGVLSYSVLQLLEWAFDLFKYYFSNKPIVFGALNAWNIAYTPNPSIPLREVFFASLIAPVVAFIASAVINFKLLNKFAQLINVSEKFGDENLFSFFLNQNEVDWVYVRDKEGDLTYRGRVISYSECDSIQEIVLSNVSVYEYKTSKFVYDLSLIYLSKKLGSFVIEVPDIRRE